MANIGQPEREIIVEPVEVPVKEPSREPDEAPIKEPTPAVPA